MGFKIKNSLTGEFEKLPILTLKGEKGETGGVEEYNKVDYMGNKYETLKQTNDANVEYAVKTAIGEFNYLDYDGQHITATDTIAGQAKNAVIEGQTLVNVDSYYTTSDFWYSNVANLTSDGYITLNATGGWNNGFTKKSNLVKPNTKYLVICEIKENTLNGVFTLLSQHENSSVFTTEFKRIQPGQTGIFKYVETTNAAFDVEKTKISLRNYLDANSTEGKVVYRTMLIEYQEGMENWDIPFFRGMSSVKMPVLTTTGKNLLNPNLYPEHATGTCEKHGIVATYNSDGSITFSGTNNGTTISTFMTGDIKPYLVDGKTYIFNYSTQITNYDGTKQWVKSFTVDKSKQEYISPYIQFSLGEVVSNVVYYPMLEEGSTTTSYEPYKSNILSTPEDLELRGIGNIKDKLNVATGELTQRIKEVVLDGSDDEVWSFGEMKGDNYKFGFNLKTDVYGSGDRTPILSDKFAVGNLQTELTQEQVMIYNHTDYMELRLTISPNKLTSNTGQALKDYLKANPFTIQYALGTPTVKTVDLSDNHVYSYKDVTHYDCSSAEGSLVPMLSVKVPTDVQATIAQQRETIQTLNSENERLNQIQEALKASMLDSQVQLMNLSWNTDFEVFTLRESIAPKDFLLASRTGSNIDKFSQAKFIIENDCPDLEKLNSQIEYYFSKDVFSQEQFEELTDLISIVKGENGCEY